LPDRLACQVRYDARQISLSSASRLSWAYCLGANGRECLPSGASTCRLEMKSHSQRSVKAKQWTIVLEIFLGVRLRLSRRVRVGVGAGVWLSQTSALLAHRREATFQLRSVVQSDMFTKCPQYLFNSVSPAVETFCTFLPAFHIVPISLNSMLMPASVQRLNG